MKKNKPHIRGSDRNNTRKAIRKQKRIQKKVHKQEHYMKKKSQNKQHTTAPGRFVKRPIDIDQAEVIEKKKSKVQEFTVDRLKKDRERDKNETTRLKSEMESLRKKMLLKANEEEDKIIKKLEKQLGLNKSKNKNSYFTDDGLDYLLEICDKDTTEQIVAPEKNLANVEGESDLEEDLAFVTGKEINKSTQSSQSNEKYSRDSKDNDATDNSDEDMLEADLEEADNSIFESDNVSEMSNDSTKELKINKKSSILSRTKSGKKEVNKLNNNYSDEDENEDPSDSQKTENIFEDNIGKIFSDDEVSHLSEDDVSNIEHDNTKEKGDIWEDIYGRKRDKEGNIIKEQKGVYIPPHLRNSDTNSEKDLTHLKRQIKSVLNKLAGTNLHWACTSIENLYSNNSRNSVNTALTQLWFDATLGRALTPDRMVAEHAALVSVLHANVASEVGAHFLQQLAVKFDQMLQTSQPVEDKTLDNLLSCLAYLYSFKIYHASLLYDILGRLLDDISEKNIDCVLVALRCAGGVLRKEEPLALKTFIHNTQTKATQLTDNIAAGSRIKFLLEVLTAVKNNNLTKIPNYDPTYVEQLKKQTRGVIRKGNYVIPLNIRLEDLLKAQERGKWWIVGSAWEGGQTKQEPAPTLPPTMDQKLMELARKQRMNTDVRRSIFCVIMSAEDYMDAFEKLQHLGLKGQQEREVVHVLLACCFQEKIYNPYYAVLAQKLCETDRKYQLSIQYSIWDKIKDLENLTKPSMHNLAQFLTHLIMEKGLPLSVLKVIQFSDLNKRSVRLMRQVLLAIIMNVDLSATLEVFQRISKSPKLRMFRESLRLFIQHFLIKNAGNTTVLNPDELETLKERVRQVDSILNMHESKFKL